MMYPELGGGAVAAVGGAVGAVVVTGFLVVFVTLGLVVGAGDATVVDGAIVVVVVDVAATVVEDAKASPLVMLRGRTDGTSDAPAESRIARDRAAAVRDYLVAAGVDPARIRATYQPAGDHVADNVSAGGRGLNRRVEIEMYRALPVALTTAAVAQP